MKTPWPLIATWSGPVCFFWLRFCQERRHAFLLPEIVFQEVEALIARPNITQKSKYAALLMLSAPWAHQQPDTEPIWGVRVPTWRQHKELCTPSLARSRGGKHRLIYPKLTAGKPKKTPRLGKPTGTPPIFENQRRNKYVFPDQSSRFGRGVRLRPVGRRLRGLGGAALRAAAGAGAPQAAALQEGATLARGLRARRAAQHGATRSPSKNGANFIRFFVGWEGSPTQTDWEKSGSPYSSRTGGPRHFFRRSSVAGSKQKVSLPEFPDV